MQTKQDLLKIDYLLKEKYVFIRENRHLGKAKHAIARSIANADYQAVMSATYGLI